jgi:molybdopterin synthase catalytic subunit
MDDNIIIKIQKEPINVKELINKMKDPKGGAISIFLGTTRDNFENKKVLNLFYEAHDTMALRKMNDIANSLVVKYDLIKIAIVHRIGEVVSFLINIAYYRRKCSYYCNKSTQTERN